MLPFTIPENIFVICSVLFLAAEAHLQTTIVDYGQHNRFQSCDARSCCIPIRRCSHFHNRWNLNGVGITCGDGMGPYRLVCCPKRLAADVTGHSTLTYTSTPPSGDRRSEEDHTRRPQTTTLVPPTRNEINNEEQTRSLESTTSVPPASNEINNATIENSGQRNRFRSCSSASNCIPIRNCSPLRDGWNKSGVGITCGYGSGPYRMVCCPKFLEVDASVHRTLRFTPQPPHLEAKEEVKVTAYFRV